MVKGFDKNHGLKWLKFGHVEQVCFVDIIFQCFLLEYCTFFFLPHPSSLFYEQKEIAITHNLNAQKQLLLTLCYISFLFFSNNI